MPKKVVDIISIEKKPWIHKEARQTAPKDIKSSSDAKKPKKNFFIFFILAIILLAAVFFGLNSQSKLDLQLTLFEEDKEIFEDIKVDGNAAISDFTKKILEGAIVDSQKTLSQEFSSTGHDEKGAKAKGVIRVFNKINPPREKSLVVQTRFLSSDGKTFKALTKIDLPPAKMENGKLTPGYQDIEVEAQEEGDSYNIGASKFSIPGLVGSSLYYDIWGESSDKMTGGSKEPVKKVIIDDIEFAKNTMEDILNSQGKEGILKHREEGFLIEEKAISIGVPEISCDKKEGDVADKFSCSGTIKSKAIAVKESSLLDFAYHILSDQVPSSTNFRMETVQVFFENVTHDFDKNSLDTKIKIQSKIYKSIDKPEISKRMAGKFQSEAEDILKREYPQVKNSEFGFWPFWLKKAPLNPNNIRIGLKFE